ncbi:unnamed protein product [Adineta steineri]|uniref:Uncharacterized protein n=1 Tax=Adineta steineri TaxID=433720 RepID=A0A820J9V2_9BILA|nr:unnamed protein product [Adineta steineri]CAF4323722.1 unnamed protein product [Adineta steineri]
MVKIMETICDATADVYEYFSKKSDIIKLHFCIYSPRIDYDNVNEQIPEIALDELIYIVQVKRKKKSVDAHGISNFMLDFLDLSH